MTDFLDHVAELLKVDPPDERVEAHEPGTKLACVCQECCWLRARKRDER